MHCCLGNWFKKKLAQSFHTCSYQHWWRLPSEPRLPISALVCLAHCGVRWKLLANPHRRSACFPGEADFPLGCALCSSPSHRTRLQWHLVDLFKSEQLRTTEINFSCFWMAGVWNHRVCRSVLPLDMRGRFGFCLYQLMVALATSFLLRSLWSHSSLTSSTWMRHPAFLSYNIGYLMKMLNGMTAVFQMRLWSHVLGNGM